MSTERLKVLMLADFLAPGGGAGTVIMQSLRYLKQRGHQVMMITGGPSLPDDERFQISRVGYEGRQAGLKAFLQSLFDFRRAISQAIKDFKPDIIHAHQPMILLTCPATSTPIVYTFHSSWHDESVVRGGRGWAIALRAWWERVAFEKVSAFITLSQYMKNKLEDLKRKPAEVLVLPGAMPKPPALSEKPWPRPYVLCARRLVPRTGVDLALQAWERLKVQGLDCLIVGDGPLRNQLEDQAGENVHFLGFVSSEELHALWAHARCALVPSRDLEGFGMATLESLLHGTPVVATPVGGTQEILGRVFPEGLAQAVSAEAIADQLKQVLDRPTDRQALADKAWSCYNPEQRGQALEALYERSVRS